MRRSITKITTLCSILAALNAIAPSASAQILTPATVSGPIQSTAKSHPFLATTHQRQPLDLKQYGYVEEEYFISGEAGVYNWPDKDGLHAVATAPYTTRILVRRPADVSDYSGTVLVEGLNPSTPVDLPIMWGESYKQFMRDKVVWVGLTLKPNVIKSLQRFDPERYASLSMPHAKTGPQCEGDTLNSWDNTTTPADETGLVWDMLTQLGILLKSNGTENPIGVPAERLYMTGQSQTAGHARTYASIFSQPITAKLGKPLYDGYLFSGTHPWITPLHQCMATIPEDDPRSLTGPAGVPVLEFFAEGDMPTNILDRRPDSDAAPDLYRRYEVAGGTHTEPYGDLSFASDSEMIKATGTTEKAPICNEGDVIDSDFPMHHAFDAGWRNLENWVQHQQPAPSAPWLSLRESAKTNYEPTTAFHVDSHGNALGGVRSSYVDVPTARWIGSKTGSFYCMFVGYKVPFSKEKLNTLYRSKKDYLRKVKASVNALQAQRWLTAEDAAEVIEQAKSTSMFK